MKYINLLVYFCVCLPFTSFSQGSTCSNAVVLTLDGVCRNFTTSSATGGNVVCTNNGTTPITWFSFTTNSIPNNILINITDPGGQPCEVAMYTACNGSNPLQIGSSMCFDDGKGLWAPEETFNLLPNTTYMLRIKTAAATTLSICAQHYTPANDNCAGASPISETGMTDNNACHKGGPDVWASDLCAITLENTAFYTYYVLNTGSTIVNISSIACDNGNGNNSNGFQMGFYTGNCASLIPFYCTSGSGSLVQATTPLLTAGTKVTLAIDGYAGSNCQYSIQAVNAFVLANNIKKFAAWKKGDANLITWDLSKNKYANIELQRSEDGLIFKEITHLVLDPGNESGHSNAFDDRHPLPVSYYRLLMTEASGNKAMSHVVTVKRTSSETLQLHFSNVISSMLIGKIESEVEEKYDMVITAMNGQIVYKNKLFCHKGLTLFEKDLSHLPNGKYFLSLKNGNKLITKPFIKY